MQLTRHHSDPELKLLSQPGALLISHDNGFVTCVTVDDASWDYFMYQLRREAPPLFAMACDASRGFDDNVQLKYKAVARMTAVPCIGGYPVR